MNQKKKYKVEQSIAQEQLNRMAKQKRFDDVKHTLRQLEGLFEIVALVLAYFLAWRYFYRESFFFRYYGNGKYVLLGIYAFLVLVLFINCDGFKFGHLKLFDIVISQWISILIINFITYFQLCLIANKMINVLPMLLLSGIDFVIVVLLSLIFTAVYHHFHVPRHMVMIYGTGNAMTLKEKMDTRTDKYRIVKTLPIDLGYKKICGEILKYDAVVINDVTAEIRNDILKFCYQNSMRAYVAPKISDIINRGAEDITLFDTPLLLIKGQGLNLAQRAAKRIMDIFICGIAMIPGSIIMGIVAAAIKMEDHGAVFYRQERVTIDGKKFNILKFRSMIENAEEAGKSIPAVDHDPRITKVGRVIRATRIDELPQLLNILKGDMSLVGPRPERTEHVEKYSEEIPEFSFRLKVRGGLTGFAQIYGKYNTSAYDKLRLDLMYIENYSLLLDIKLILMTLRIMLKSESTEGFDKAPERTSLQEAAATSVERRIEDVS